MKVSLTHVITGTVLALLASLGVVVSAHATDGQCYREMTNKGGTVYMKFDGGVELKFLNKGELRARSHGGLGEKAVEVLKIQDGSAGRIIGYQQTGTRKQATVSMYGIRNNGSFKWMAVVGAPNAPKKVVSNLWDNEITCATIDSGDAEMLAAATLKELNIPVLEAEFTLHDPRDVYKALGL